MKPPFIERVIIKNYKSIAKCDVRLGPLQFLVGRNGAGKSNFLDALAFVRDALFHNLEHAFSTRQGIDQVRRRSGGHPKNFGIALCVNLPDNITGRFAFELSSRGGGEFYVKEEQGILTDAGGKRHYYHTREGKITTSQKEGMPPIASDRLYLQNMATYEQFRPLYDALRTMGFYNINPSTMVVPRQADTETSLKSDGSNIATCMAAMSDSAKKEILAYMQEVVPFVSDFNPKATVGQSWKMVEFSQKVKGQKYPWHFLPISMSDGTLRVLGILTAILQQRKGDSSRFPALVGIEEPETALHARASGILLDALSEGAEQRQVVVTTHSADMLDNKEIQPDHILAVKIQESETCIGPLSETPKELLQEHLITAGELLRQDKLQPKLFESERKLSQLNRQLNRQLNLFIPIPHE